MRQLGRYRLERRIAAGGMAEVFLARRRGPADFEKEVVIKCILPFRAEDERLIEMFLNEARLAAQLTHPNIVQIYELGREEGIYFIAMEYIQGLSLAQVRDITVELGTPLPYHYAARIVANVCAGLDYAHNFRDAEGRAVGIVHRDVSPENTIVGRNGAVKTIDFGIAKAQTHKSQTDDGDLKGKWSYMSPEQISQGELDGRSDLFSLGIVLFELVTGRHPFVAEANLDALMAILSDEPKRPTALRPDMPAELERILLRALEKDRDDRYQSGRELQRELERFIQSHAQVVSEADLGELVSALDRGDASDALFLSRLFRECLHEPGGAPVTSFVPAGLGDGVVVTDPGEGASGRSQRAGEPSRRASGPGERGQGGDVPGAPSEEAEQGVVPTGTPGIFDDDPEGPDGALLPAPLAVTPGRRQRGGATFLARAERRRRERQRVWGWAAAAGALVLLSLLVWAPWAGEAPSPWPSPPPGATPRAGPVQPANAVAETGGRAASTGHGGAVNAARAEGSAEAGSAGAGGPDKSNKSAAAAAPQVRRSQDESLRRIHKGALGLKGVPQGVVCEVSGVVVARRDLGAYPVQPGEQRVACDDPARGVWRFDVRVGEGERVVVSYPAP